MRTRFSVLMLVCLLVVFVVQVKAMTEHWGTMYVDPTSGDVSCWGYMSYPNTPTNRTVSVWLRAPSGQLLDFSTLSAIGINENIRVEARGPNVGSGTYTCEAHFEEFGPAIEEYDVQNYQLFVN